MALKNPPPPAVKPAKLVSGWSKPPVPIQLFHQSSQFRNWRYSKEGLDKIRNELNVQAVGRVKSNVEEERKELHHTSPSSGPSSASTSELPPPPPPPSEIEYLTVSDELSLVTYYLTQIAALCGAFKFPEMVQATAMTYLKRFYLRNTCMDYHPKNVMLTSVFLATKTENFPISIDTFASKTKTTPEDILSLEFLVSQSLKFEYKVHHAHLAARGLSLDMQTTNLPTATIDATYGKVLPLLRTSRLTDLEFIYTPSQIALACFNLIEPSTVLNWLSKKEELKAFRDGEDEEEGADGGEVVEEKVKTKGKGKGKEDLEREGLIKILNDIGEVVMECQKNPVDKEKVKDVDKRLRWARNPEKDPNSALYKKRKAEEELEKEEHQRAKLAKRASTSTTSDADVFN